MHLHLLAKTQGQGPTHLMLPLLVAYRRCLQMCSNISWAVEQLRASKTCIQHPQTTPIKDGEDRSLGVDQKLSPKGPREWPECPPPKHHTKECALLSAPTLHDCPSVLSPTLLEEPSPPHWEDPMRTQIPRKSDVQTP